MVIKPYVSPIRNIYLLRSKIQILKIFLTADACLSYILNTTTFKLHLLSTWHLNLKAIVPCIVELQIFEIKVYSANFYAVLMRVACAKHKYLADYKQMKLGTVVSIVVPLRCIKISYIAFSIGNQQLIFDNLAIHNYFVWHIGSKTPSHFFSGQCLQDKIEIL